jgi:hypothetical protein
MYPFRALAATQSTASSGSSQGVTINVVGGTRTIRFANIGTVTVFVAFGVGSAPTAALASSMPLLANTVEAFTIPPDVTHYSLIASGAGSTLYSTIGVGE